MRKFAFFTMLACLGAAPVLAGSIALEWDAVPGADGYRVYYGETSRQYDGFVEVQDTSHDLGNLVDCTEYFVAVKAVYRSSNQEVVSESADFSNEVVGWARPEISVTTPAEAGHGDQIVMTVSGANFQDGATIEFSNPGLTPYPANCESASRNTVPDDRESRIRVDSIDWISCTELQAVLTVEPRSAGGPAAAAGIWSLAVLNPPEADGQSVFGENPNGFEVELDRTRQDVNQSLEFTRDRLDGMDSLPIRRLYPTDGASTCRDAKCCAQFDYDLDINDDGWIDGGDLALAISPWGACWDAAAGQWSLAACSDHPSNASNQASMTANPGNLTNQEQ